MPETLNSSAILARTAVCQWTAVQSANHAQGRVSSGLTAGLLHSSIALSNLSGSRHPCEIHLI